MLNIYASESNPKQVQDMIKRIARMAEYREPLMYSHIERMRGYTSVIASAIGLTKQAAEMICISSQLHDVGKIGLPDEIIMKSDKLSPYEMEVMKRHPSIGAELLKDSPSVILQAGALIAFTHHERWDGSGYPRGISKEDIPLSGRICGVCDVFDALITKRSYKTDISFDDAVQLIKEEAGRLFDPRVVEVFVENKEQILKVYNSLA